MRAGPYGSSAPSRCAPPAIGFYFVGLEFPWAATSATITGVSRDAEHVVKTIVARGAARRPELVAAS